MLLFNRLFTTVTTCPLHSKKPVTVESSLSRIPNISNVSFPGMVNGKSELKASVIVGRE